ncbi:Phosphoenolpyruvate/pyruvate domain-containing protein [Eremomyces bilateralis CBS 781.70]|uniref:Phosphoenolpyruvate/pyruvate domain-containing protein n=1 Tax=Eremomyces bilateralis CBS 781.70 TaxID=1392243 RepID=A0A6G1GHT3_9PEZI|nr:Phosphoenolpyruvate/pyruvate domain-containing protein [Eremomyces bilateralis CBS 781.70]KAF1817613.1 Phosphoenolpyruvate/pyruvate domain-containing protein [Eremomyces bilateralis CBS 781.70]
MSHHHYTDTRRSSTRLQSLHQPGNPLILTNIYDLSSLNAVLSLNTPSTTPVQAIATASFAFAAQLGIPDEALTLDQNLAATAAISARVREANLPLTVDLQDGYGERITEAVRRAVELGAAGANIEDSIPSAGFGRGVEGSLYPVELQVQRLRGAREAARRAGSPDFVINARTDVFRLDEPPEEALEEAVRRGKAYLAAGATTVFVWGGRRGVRTDEVMTLVDALKGRVAVKLGDGPNSLTTKELAHIGVARVSVGPSLWLMAMKAVTEGARRILEGGRLSG